MRGAPRPRARAGAKPTKQLAAKKRKRRKNKVKQNNRPREGTEALADNEGRSPATLPPLRPLRLFAANPHAIRSGK